MTDTASSLRSSERVDDKPKRRQYTTEYKLRILQEGSHLDPMKKVANLVVTRMKGILNIFRLKQSNANAESLNARIQAVRVKSRGHRSYDAFRRDILFHLGGLDLHPVFPT
jgi:transposase